MKKVEKNIKRDRERSQRNNQFSTAGWIGYFSTTNLKWQFRNSQIVLLYTVTSFFKFL